MSYPVLSITSNQILDDEQLGSKAKFWFEHNGQKWLFKEARVITGRLLTGEDWTEKVAADIAALISIDAAKVELAMYQGRRGSAALNFIPADNVHLEHGNEVLAGYLSSYDSTKKQHQSDHTLNNIIDAIQHKFPAPADHRAVLEKLASYMVLDALIGNTDRHHENWGLFWQTLLFNADTQTALWKKYDVAPSFDHASSLGRELLDERRIQMIETNTIDRYIRQGRGGIYWSRTDKHGVSPLLLVERAAIAYPDYFRSALLMLSNTPLSAIQTTLNDVPSERASDVSKTFAKLLLEKTYQRLIGLLT